MSFKISPSNQTPLAIGVALAIALFATDAGTIAAQPQPQGMIQHVNCVGGQSLADAVRHSREGQTIHVSGICHERVTITTSRLTLSGGGTAVIDGVGVAMGADPEFDGLVVINGVTGVTLTGLTIQNSSANGVLAQRGAAFTMHDVVVQDNAVTGIVVVDHSSAELTDTATIRNRLGLDVVTSSSAVIKGAFASNQNTENGVDINGSAVVELRGAQVELNQNAGYGLVASSGSRVAIFGWQASHGSTLTADSNGFAGLIIADASLTSYVPAQISASNNTFGLLLNDGRVVAPFGETKFLLENNTVGMNLRNGSQVLIAGGLTVQSNGTGVLADAAGPLTLTSVPANPSAITGNVTDMRLQFGTRSTIDGVTIGTMVCDATVLSRGTKTCP